jgi:hypothetical protein
MKHFLILIFSTPGVHEESQKSELPSCWKGEEELLVVLRYFVVFEFFYFACYLANHQATAPQSIQYPRTYGIRLLATFWQIS